MSQTNIHRRPATTMDFSTMPPYRQSLGIQKPYGMFENQPGTLPMSMDRRNSQTHKECKQKQDNMT